MRRRKPMVLSTATSLTRSRTLIAAVLAAISTTAATTRKPTSMIILIRPLNALR